MPSTIPIKLAIPAWCTIGLVGFLIGRKTPEPDQSADPPQAIANQQAEVSAPAEKRPFDPSSHAHSFLASGDFDSSEFEYAVTIWARTDVEAATRFVLENVPPMKQSSFLSASIAYPFSAAAPELVTRSAMETGDEKVAYGMLSVLGSRISSGKVESTLGHIDSLPDGKVKALARRNIVSAWQDFDFGAVSQWASAIDDPELRAKTINSIVSHTDGKDGVKAAEFISSLEGEEQQKAIWNFGGQVRFDEPGLYMDVAAKYKDGGLNSASLGFIGAEIASNDPDYAIALAQRIPPGKTRRRVFGDIAEHWARSEPFTAAEWASSIKDPKDREAALSNLKEK